MPKKLLRRWMPDPRRIRNHRLVSWLGPRLHDPRLLHISREGIARGAAVGGFFGLLIPIGQIPAAAVAAVAWRANLPMAVAGTLITNPFTFAPIYYLAYRIGLFLLGADPLPSDAPDPFAVASPEHATWYKLWYERVLGAGRPLFIGLFVLACGYATFSYFAISLLWRAYTLRAWRRRAKRN
jgi:uncharacterized protein (DUF2062 family)